MFGLFKDKARENATKAIRLMAHFYPVQKGITLEELDKLAAQQKITISRDDDPKTESYCPPFPELILTAYNDYGMTEVTSLVMCGHGKMTGFAVHLTPKTERVSVYIYKVHGVTSLARNTAKKLIMVADDIEPTLGDGGISGLFGLEELDRQKESI